MFMYFSYKKKRIQDASSEEAEAVEFVSDFCAFVELMDVGLVASCLITLASI